MNIQLAQQVQELHYRLGDGLAQILHIRRRHPRHVDTPQADDVDVVFFK